MNYDHNALTLLADPTRQAILDQLALRPCSVRELTEALPVSQPAVSQHLGKLRAARLVCCYPKGASNLYQIDPAGLAAVRSILDRYWAAALENFKTLAEET